MNIDLNTRIRLINALTSAHSNCIELHNLADFNKEKFIYERELGEIDELKKILGKLNG